MRFAHSDKIEYGQIFRGVSSRSKVGSESLTTPDPSETPILWSQRLERKYLVLFCYDLEQGNSGVGEYTAD
ncbi:MAG: hypothetical protein C5B49_11500 [Bdellovibrio sp.]|nr:MAG: hypothetical protein C5B49_11500 [Bdellovibrio sp.]